jgi:hypothetical protein
MGGSTGNGAYWLCDTSTGPSLHGCDGSSRAFDAGSKRRRTGCGAFRAGTRTCLRTGRWVFGPMLSCKSRMRRESHVRFREGAGVKFPRATRRNVYVGSRRAGERVMGLLRRLFARLHLRVNEEKSAVDLATSRKILGYSFWYAPGRTVKLRVASKALGQVKDRIRRTTRRTRGRSMAQVVEELREYLPGWRQYFLLAETPGVFGSSHHSILRRAWSPATPGRHLNFTNRPVRTRTPGGVAGVAGVTRRPYADFAQSPVSDGGHWPSADPL